MVQRMEEFAMTWDVEQCCEDGKEFIKIVVEPTFV